MKAKFALAAAAGLLACGSAFAGQYATALGQCMYNNSSAEDQKVFTQWAFVNLGQTDAAKEITTIPAAKVQEINDKTKSAATSLVAGSCAKEAAQVALHEPKTGMQDAVSTIATEMIKNKIQTQAKQSVSSSWLSAEQQQQLQETGSALKQAGQSLRNLFGGSKK